MTMEERMLDRDQYIMAIFNAVEQMRRMRNRNPDHSGGIVYIASENVAMSMLLHDPSWDDGWRHEASVYHPINIENCGYNLALGSIPVLIGDGFDEDDKEESYLFPALCITTDATESAILRDGEHIRIEDDVYIFRSQNHSFLHVGKADSILSKHFDMNTLSSVEEYLYTVRRYNPRTHTVTAGVSGWLDPVFCSPRPTPVCNPTAPSACKTAVVEPWDKAIKPEDTAELDKFLNSFKQYGERKA